MKLALLGDVHGNADALSAVLAATRARGADMLLVTGDLVGYYYEPDRVLGMLADWPMVAVRGNHEDYLQSAAGDAASRSSYRTKYGSGLEAALERLTGRQLAWLNALPRTASLCIDGLSILLCHGSPRDTDEYVYPTASRDLIDDFASFGHDVVIMGHTHWRFIWKHEAIIAVNPGSVGQPRDRRPGAAWAMLNTTNRDIELYNEQYDVARLLDQVAQRDPHIPYLQQVLTRT